MRDRIEINKNLIPYRFDIVLAGRAYTTAPASWSDTPLRT